ncbi:uncharacterized protein [Heterodontus francisci]|uniref:uncharacterized protein isoform X2 n=1 Tax=Heterodontus francisci TaxID=7792 RepID=UPI00355BCA75
MRWVKKLTEEEGCGAVENGAQHSQSRLQRQEVQRLGEHQILLEYRCGEVPGGKTQESANTQLPSLYRQGVESSLGPGRPLCVSLVLRTSAFGRQRVRSSCQTRRTAPWSRASGWPVAPGSARPSSATSAAVSTPTPSTGSGPTACQAPPLTGCPPPTWGFSPLHPGSSATASGKGRGRRSSHIPSLRSKWRRTTEEPEEEGESWWSMGFGVTPSSQPPRLTSPPPPPPPTSRKLLELARWRDAPPCRIAELISHVVEDALVQSGTAVGGGEVVSSPAKVQSSWTPSLTTPPPCLSSPSWSTQRGTGERGADPGREQNPLLTLSQRCRPSALAPAARPPPARRLDLFLKHFTMAAGGIALYKDSDFPQRPSLHVRASEKCYTPNKVTF